MQKNFRASILKNASGRRLLLLIQLAESQKRKLLIYTIMLVLEDQRRQFTDHFKIRKILRFDVWDKVSKNGLREFCGRQPLKNLLSSLLDTFFHIFILQNLND